MTAENTPAKRRPNLITRVTSFVSDRFNIYPQGSEGYISSILSKHQKIHELTEKERTYKLDKIDGQLSELSGGQWNNPRQMDGYLRSIPISRFWKDAHMFIHPKEINRMENGLIAISETPVWDSWKDRVVNLRDNTEGNKSPYILMLPHEIVAHEYKSTRPGSDYWKWFDSTRVLSLDRFEPLWNNAHQADPNLPGIKFGISEPALQYAAFDFDDSTTGVTPSPPILEAYTSGPLKGSRNLRHSEQYQLRDTVVGPDANISGNILFAMIFDFLRRGKKMDPDYDPTRDPIRVDMWDSFYGYPAYAGFDGKSFGFDITNVESPGLGARIGISEKGFERGPGEKKWDSSWMDADD